MSDFRKIAEVQQLPELGAAREFLLDEKIFCVANVNGEYFALDNVCPHRGGPLGQGFVDGTKIVCPWHGWHIEAATGTANGQPAVAVHELRIEGNEVLVKI